jgi:hypothetical protein
MDEIRGIIQIVFIINKKQIKCATAARRSALRSL